MTISRIVLNICNAEKISPVAGGELTMMIAMPTHDEEKFKINSCDFEVNLQPSQTSAVCQRKPCTRVKLNMISLLAKYGFLMPHLILFCCVMIST
jgi:hypothetical protein